MPQSYDFIFISARDFWEKLQEKSLQGSEQLYPRLCPTLPKALGIYARNCRFSVPAFSGVGAHDRGHESSCTRADYAFLQNVSCFFRNHHVFSFWLKIYKNTANMWHFELKVIILQSETRKGARVAEEARLESVYSPKGNRGFESPSFRFFIYIIRYI